VTGPAEPFTWSLYAEYLRLAASCGYRFADFSETTTGSDDPGERVVYLRHDVDFALRWVLHMAEIEHEHDVRATYCFLLDSPYYSSTTAEFDATVRRVLELGHWLGLHFDATRIDADEDVAHNVADAAASLRQRFGTDVVAVSFHMPGRRPVSHIGLPSPLVNTYSPAFFYDIGYASDSNMDWRGTDFAELVTSGRHARLQLLTHPIWWRATHASMRDKLTELADELGIGLDEVATDEQLALIDASADRGARVARSHDPNER
jgi:hypothetical protein